MLIRENKFLRCLFLFFIGGFVYGGVEILYRGYSHISMFLAGGGCFVLIGTMNRLVPRDTSLVIRAAIAAVIITAVELFIGVIVNLWMKLGVWDYSALPFNFKGQICLYYMIAWFGLSFIVIRIDEYFKYYILKEEKTKYKIL